MYQYRLREICNVEEYPYCMVAKPIEIKCGKQKRRERRAKTRKH
jgi:hypothetical protein